jgi:parvulin-like peptidyl-prolyl isomerase
MMNLPSWHWRLLALSGCLGAAACAADPATAPDPATTAPAPATVVVASTVGTPAPSVNAEVMSFDQSLRYVNGDVITVSDMRRRTFERKMEDGRAGKVGPNAGSTVAERTAYDQVSLDELTGETLLLQKAKELKMTPDHDRIAMMVLDEAKAAGHGYTLKDQAERRKELEREESINLVLRYYYQTKAPDIEPASMWKDYQAHQADYNMPPRVHVLQIIMRPSDPGERQDLATDERNTFRDAQGAVDAALQQAAVGRVDALVAAPTPADQQAILDAALKDIAAADARNDLGDADRKLTKHAVALLARKTAFRDSDQTVAALDAIRQSLIGKGEDAFRAAAKANSQGPNADLGGELGWLEPGFYPAVFDQNVFPLAAGAMSPVFLSNSVACLVYVVANDPPRVRSFAEVTGNLTADLERQRLAAIKAQAIAILKVKASIRDVIPLSSLTE